MSLPDRSGIALKISLGIHFFFVCLCVAKSVTSSVSIYSLRRTVADCLAFIMEFGKTYNKVCFPIGERRRRLAMSSSTPRCEEDCDLRGAGGVLGGHWRRWRRALLGRSSSAPSSTADLGDLVAKFPQMEEVLQVYISIYIFIIIWWFVLVAVVVTDATPDRRFGGPLGSLRSVRVK